MRGGVGATTSCVQSTTENQTITEGAHVALGAGGDSGAQPGLEGGLAHAGMSTCGPRFTLQRLRNTGVGEGVGAQPLLACSHVCKLNSQYNFNPGTLQTSPNH